jgi:hypothetical protein
MSTRLAATAACICTFVLLMHLTTVGAVPSRRTALPYAGLSRIQRVIADMAPVSGAALVGVRGPAARRCVAVAP